MLALNLRSGWVARARGRADDARGRAGRDRERRLPRRPRARGGEAAYAASKAAALALFDSLAADLKGTGVRVNSVLPSLIDTEANRKAMPKSDFAKWPKPDEIARVILFLCGEDAKLVDGAAIPVYGGS